MATLTSARLSVVQAASSVVGWTAPSPAYLRLVAPWEMRNGLVARAASIANASDCALAAHGILDLAFALPQRGRYIVEHAISDLVAVARDAGAYVDHPIASPRAGDVVHLAPFGIHGEHVGTIVEEPEDLAFIDGIPVQYSRVDGGQRDEMGRETVLRMIRPLVFQNGWWREAGTDRDVAGIVDCDAMGAFYGVRGSAAAAESYEPTAP